jgi:methylthioribose-1-phosphate isomerase
MVVRGAPAIGVTGALALAVHLISGGRGKQYASVQACLDDIAATMDYLVTRWGSLAAAAATAAAASILPAAGMPAAARCTGNTCSNRQQQRIAQHLHRQMNVCSFPL